MIDTFPSLSERHGLVADDFIRFSQSYAEILRKRLPTAQKIQFCSITAQFNELFPGERFSDEVLPLFMVIKNGEKEVVVHPECLMLSFPLNDGDNIIAVVSEADPLFFKKVSDDWLVEIKNSVEREFLLLKEARVDMQTGLLNLANLYYLLDTYSHKRGLHLILLELPPSRTSFQYALRHSQKCTTLILNYLQSDSSLHYLGQCTFALVMQLNEGRNELGSGLVAYLKREGCPKVHIGSSSSRNGNESIAGEGKKNGRNVLDEAWTALRHAVKRGPYSFCDYNKLAYPENHPLAIPAGHHVRRLKKQWLRADLFCLIHFRCQNNLFNLQNLLVPLINQQAFLISANELIVFLDGADAATAKEWAQELIGQIARTHPMHQLSAGVACYPLGDFRKSEMIVNCHKALLHGSFFGESSVVVFDSVSLNISGDVYFGDGDLASAVREYKRGLKLDPEDVNLHNSLGVALAMMSKLTLAMQSFERALTLDAHNFMTLYNLGLAEQARGRWEEAFTYLEKALSCYQEEDGNPAFIDDLQLQLGMLACDTGRYAIALQYLLEWTKSNENNPRKGRVLYYIGKANHGAGNNRQAMIDLQRALQFNEFDDRAMNLLGIIYYQEREGDEIALSLCRKSVELEPNDIVYRCNLAEVQLQCNAVGEARVNLYRCLKSKKCRMRAQILLAKSYRQGKMLVRAKSWFKKALEQETGQPEYFAEAEKGMRELSMI